MFYFPVYCVHHNHHPHQKCHPLHSVFCQCFFFFFYTEFWAVVLKIHVYFQVTNTITYGGRYVRCGCCSWQMTSMLETQTALLWPGSPSWNGRTTFLLLVAYTSTTHRNALSLWHQLPNGLPSPPLSFMHAQCHLLLRPFSIRMSSPGFMNLLSIFLISVKQPPLGCCVQDHLELTFTLHRLPRKRKKGSVAWALKKYAVIYAYFRRWINV